MFSKPKQSEQYKESQPIYEINNDQMYRSDPNRKGFSIPLLNTISSFNQLPEKQTTSIKNYGHLLQNEDSSDYSSKIVTMVSMTDKSIHFHDQAAHILTFIGIWGHIDSDKTYFYDKILNLCGIQQDKYHQFKVKNQRKYQGEKQLSQNTKNEENLVFYERPFKKGNLRAFLLEPDGYKRKSKLSRKQKMQLDIMMSICSVIVLIEPPNPDPNCNILRIAHDHFQGSFRRLYINKNLRNKEQSFSSSQQSSEMVQQICWPKSLFVIYTDSQSIKKHHQMHKQEKQLQNMFADFNFSILHNVNPNSANSYDKQHQQIQAYTSIANPLDQLYMKNTSNIFQQIYYRLQPKAYTMLKFNGITMPHIISQMTDTLNNHNAMYMPRVFEKVRKSVYNSLYSRHALGYLMKLNQNYLKDERPQNTDYLLKAFNQVSQETMREYDESYSDVNVVGNANRNGGSDQLYEAYERKLQQYMNEKEKNILAINTKKSMQDLQGKNKMIMNSMGGIDSKDQFQKYAEHNQKMCNEYDQNAHTFVVGNTLKQYYRGSNNDFQEQNYYPNSQQEYNNTNQEEASNGYDDQQIQIKRSLLSTKMNELQVLKTKKFKDQELLGNQMVEINKYQTNQKQLQQQLGRLQQRITILRSKEQNDPSFINNNNEQLVRNNINSKQQQLQELRKMLKTTLKEKQTQDQINKQINGNSEVGFILDNNSNNALDLKFLSTKDQQMQKNQLLQTQLNSLRNQITQMEKQVQQKKIKTLAKSKIAQIRPTKSKQHLRKTRYIT